MESAMDDAVGRVLGQLRQHGLEENTLIFFFSDNGGPTPSTTSSNGPLRVINRRLGKEESESLSWSSGSRSSRGKVEDRPVIQLISCQRPWRPAQATTPSAGTLDGVNLLLISTEQNTTLPHPQLYWRFGKQMAIRVGDWKLVKGVGMGGIEGIEVNERASTEALNSTI